jgi:hypothetical protein
MTHKLNTDKITARINSFFKETQQLLMAVITSSDIHAIMNITKCVAAVTEKTPICKDPKGPKRTLYRYIKLPFLLLLFCD